MRGKSQARGDVNDAVVIKRKSLHESSSRFNLKCEDEVSRSNSILPGQAEEIEAIVHDLAYSCVYVDEDSGITSGTASTLSTNRDISIRAITGPEFNTESVGLESSLRSLESLITTEKKRFPALTTCEKPQRVKKAMFESLLTAVPSLKYVTTGSCRRSKQYNCRSTLHTDIDFEDDEAHGEFVLDRMCSSGGGDDWLKAKDLEKEQYYNSFTTVQLLNKDVEIFDRQRMLSRVDEYPEDKLN